MEYSELAKKQLEEYKKLNIDDYFVCIAKTPASFSDNPKLLNVPKDHTLHIRQINIAAGSKFIIPISGTILTMPGLPKIPAAVKMVKENVKPKSQIEFFINKSAKEFNNDTKIYRYMDFDCFLQICIL